MTFLLSLSCPAHRSWVSRASAKEGTFSFALWLWRMECSYLQAINKWSIYLQTSSCCCHNRVGKHITAGTGLFCHL